jgi:hypothetical protein
VIRLELPDVDAAQVVVTACGAALMAGVLLFFFGGRRPGAKR